MRLAVALAACLMGFGFGCSDDESTQPATTTSGTGAGGTGAGGQGATAAVNLMVIGLDGNPLEDVEVCDDGASPANCQTSDTSGVVSLDLPADVELTLRMEKTGHMTRLAPIETVPNLHLLYYQVMVTKAEASAFAQALGVTMDDSKGWVAFSLISQDAPAVAATLSPPSGDGPFYYDATLTPLPQATEIPAGGGALFMNVDPGTPTLGFGPGAPGCAFFSEAWGTDADATPVRIEANTHTGVMDLECQ
ncbi:MAG: hypothetical protein JRI68_04825 [Deltaproteobacteria bacterium]|nr:hypothetical protein [Deltaproteobacteria bacterium]